jgi:apolipoprotein N-acyltransferase
VITHLYTRIVPGNPHDGELREADVEINGMHYAWDRQSYPPKTRNLKALLAHELGHVLGLGHVYIPAKRVRSPALHEVAGYPNATALILFLTITLWQGSRSAIIALLTTLGIRRKWPTLATFPVALVVAESIYPMAFPWTSAVLLNAHPNWLQLADLGGPLLLSFWLAVVNAALTTAWLRRHKGHRRVATPVGIGAAIVFCVTVYGLLRVQAVEQSTAQTPTLRIGVVQGNIGVGANGDSAVIYREMSLTLVRTEPHLDLIIWPEGAVSYPTHVSKVSQFFRNHGLRDRRKGVGTGWLNVPVLSGMTIANNKVDEVTSGARRVGDLLNLGQTDLEDLSLSNAAVLVAPTGHVRGIYNKQHLMPIGEPAPFADWFPQMQTTAPPKTAYMVVGPAEALMLHELRLLVSICYEDILYKTFRATVQQLKPDLLVNVTNDRWFSGSAASKLYFAWLA